MYDIEKITKRINAVKTFAERVKNIVTKASKIEKEQK